MNTDLAATLKRCAAAIADAEALLVTAGAGMGVDSGLPDFRGNEGFWKAYPALARSGTSFTEIASPAAFRADAARAWGFYGHRLRLYRDTVPHEGFRLLHDFADDIPRGAFVLTSNVDGQFQKAGFEPARVAEIHGSIHHLQCLQPCRDTIWEAAGFTPRVDESACRLDSEPPRCPHCGGIARPNILMFDDWDWIDTRSAAQREALAAWLERVKRLVVIEIGAGVDIPTIRLFSERIGGNLVRINPRAPDIPGHKGLSVPLEGLAALREIHRHWKLLRG
ncbi:SIR2 family NAD-dependent protein deacylase [Aromatoleum evansii]|uniref:SIR2 family NAD-dependent protein deacylase n=1 Tax=Aromatoleum evansii TaxID=59406 RepID=UPI00145DDD1E|nr:Sir2 family NAD-dependent protein deacetylase [Aromatoleum evansii]NMG27407.1 NAD-dependent deacetylase [Aromatoleum evansii]